MSLVGHEAVFAELQQDLPPVTLLLGPPSIGKGHMAMLLLLRHSPARGAYYGKLTAAAAREIVEAAPIRAGGLVTRVIRLDDATEAAQNILLKVLEEPPPHSRFILISATPPLPTIMSRSRVYRLGCLTDQQVAEILHSEYGVGTYEAGEAALHARGQVVPALKWVQGKERSRAMSVVATAIRVAQAGGTALDMAMRNWTPEHTEILREWATEAATGRWTAFTPDFAQGVPTARARSLLEALASYRGTRTGPAVALAMLREWR